MSTPVKRDKDPFNRTYPSGGRQWKSALGRDHREAMTLVEAVVGF
jgi:hypothetical protein